MAAKNSWRERFHDIQPLLSCLTQAKDADFETQFALARDERTLIFALWRLFQEPSTGWLQAYENLSTKDISDKADELFDLICHDNSTIEDLPTKLNDAVLFAASLLWAVEAHYLGANYAASDAILVEHNGEKGHFIPYAPSFRTTQNAHPRSVAFALRGLKSSRILPERSITGHGLKIVVAPPSSKIKDVIEVAGGLFEATCLTNPDQDNGNFSFAQTETNDDQIFKDAGAILTEAFKKGCDILLLPELTIPSRLINKLVQRFIEEQPPGVRSPFLFVPGSWHVPDQSGKIRNQALVFSQAGAELGRHNKLFRYSDTVLGKERIEEGQEVLILVSPHGTFAIAICYDFCRECDTNPYDNLDVDVVLVISMGGKETIGSHAKKASSIYIKRRAQVFVVQQNSSSDYGFVFSCDVSQMKTEILVDECATAERFNKRQIRKVDSKS